MTGNVSNMMNYMAMNQETLSTINPKKLTPIHIIIKLLKDFFSKNFESRKRKMTYRIQEISYKISSTFLSRNLAGQRQWDYIFKNVKF